MLWARLLADRDAGATATELVQRTRPVSERPALAAMIVILLLAGFGDGIGYALTAVTGMRSPWIFLLPVAVLPLGWYLLAHGISAVTRCDAYLIGACALFSVFVVGAEWAFVGSFYVAGLLQLLVFLLLVTVIRNTFASAPDWLDAISRRAMPLVHYFLCGYVVLSYLSWHLLGWDPSIRGVLESVAPRVVSYYGFRPTGFSAEPQWAAIALAASYTGVHHLAPHHRVNALIALVLAAEALQSATGYAFVAFVMAVHIVRLLRSAHDRAPRLAVIWVLVVFLATCAILIDGSLILALALEAVEMVATSVQSMLAQVLLAFGITVFQVRRMRSGAARSAEVILSTVLLAFGLAVAAVLSSGASPPSPITGTPSATPVASRTGVTGAPRSASPTTAPARTPAVRPPSERATNVLTGQDPSTLMRLRSADVAWRVITQAFPVGVGYGNFREHAVYPPEFARTIPNFERVESYKSDFFVLNYVAELGLIGVILMAFLAGILIWTRQALLVGFVAMITAVSGTVLLPPVLAVSAIAGLLERERRMARSDLAGR